MLMKKNIIEIHVLCYKCHNLMNLNKNKNNKDGLIVKKWYL